jgi:hypothetical protein
MRLTIALIVLALCGCSQKTPSQKVYTSSDFHDCTDSTGRNWSGRPDGTCVAADATKQTGDIKADIKPDGLIPATVEYHKVNIDACEWVNIELPLDGLQIREGKLVATQYLIRDSNVKITCAMYTQGRK